MLSPSAVNEGRNLLSGSREAFHHEAGTAFRDVCDDRRATVNFRHDAEIDRECEVDRRTFFQAEILGFDEDAVCAEITRSAQLAWAAGNGDEDRRARTMACMKASLHLQPLDSS